MSFKVKHLSLNRRIIYNMLRRSVTKHASVTGCFHWDVTQTLARIEREKLNGRDIGMAAFMTKATAMVMKDNPKLNQRLIHRWYGLRIVEWDEISCNLIVERTQNDGESIIVPVVLRNVDQLSIEQIHQIIRNAKTGKMSNLPAFANRKKAGRLPHWVLTLFDHWISTRPKAFIKQFGTYNLSTLMHSNSGGAAGSAVGPSTTFYPTNIEDKPHVHKGEIKIRKMMLFGVLVDHYVVDGLASLTAMNQLRPLIENPDLLLGPETVDVSS